MRRLVHALTEVKEKVRFCVRLRQRVRGRAVPDLPRPAPRPAAILCVVEEPKDVVAIERTREFRGRYHVLGGAITPIEGIGPDDLRVRELAAPPRLRRGHRAHHRHRPQHPGRGHGDVPLAAAQALGLRVTRLASGLPVGGDLEYADEVTLGRAFEGRRLMDV